MTTVKLAFMDTPNTLGVLTHSPLSGPLRPAAHYLELAGGMARLRYHSWDKAGGDCEGAGALELVEAVVRQSRGEPVPGGRCVMSPCDEDGPGD